MQKKYVTIFFQVDFWGCASLKMWNHIFYMNAFCRYLAYGIYFFTLCECHILRNLTQMKFFLHMFSYLCTFTCKKAPFWFLNFLINKKVLRMYEAYFLFNLTKNIIVIFSILGLLSHFTNIIWFSHIFPKKGKPNFWKSFHIYMKN